MADPLTSQQAVEAALLRPLTDTEAMYINTLIERVSAMLRTKLSAVDGRLARFKANATDPGGLDPVAVEGMLAEVIKRYMANPDGAVARTSTTGPYSKSTTYALSRAGKGGVNDLIGKLVITSDDLEVLYPAGRRRPGSIRVRPSLAPSPVGRYGAPASLDEALVAVDEYAATPDEARQDIDNLAAEDWGQVL